MGDLIALLTKPEIAILLVGFVTKMLSDLFKKLAKDVDENGVKQGYKVPLQLIVMICTAIATMADLALKGQLSSYPIQDLMNFLTVALPGYLAALGIHMTGKAAFQHFFGRETLLPKK